MPTALGALYAVPVSETLTESPSFLVPISLAHLCYPYDSWVPPHVLVPLYPYCYALP